MFVSKQTEERATADRIAALQRELDTLAPDPHIEAPLTFTLEDSNIIRPDFNTRALASENIHAYMHDLPRRQGLERQIAFLQRRLAAIQVHAAHVRAFNFAA